MLEQPLVRLGASIWHRPGAGRFYRSVTARYGDRLRQSRSNFRRVMVGDTPLILDVTEFTASGLYFGNVPYEPRTDTSQEGAPFFVSQFGGNSVLSSLMPAASTLAIGGLSPDRTILVRTGTFDRWLAASGVRRVDLVKIDTEGAEAHVVRGMSEALRDGRVGAVVCETRWDSDAHRLLCGFGLVPQALETVGPLANIAYAQPH